MRASALFAAVVGAAAGFGGAVMFAPRVDERAPPSDAVPSHESDCLARLDAIDEKLASLALLAAPASAPTRVAAEDTRGAKVEERLAAIEAALALLASKQSAAVNGREELPRRAKDVAAIDRLFEAEYAKRLVRRDDHLGYTADRLYDRYGAPDYVSVDSSEHSSRWTYNDSSGSRGVIFYLRDGVVVNEDPWNK